MGERLTMMTNRDTYVKEQWGLFVTMATSIINVNLWGSKLVSLMDSFFLLDLT